MGFSSVSSSRVSSSRSWRNLIRFGDFSFSFPSSSSSFWFGFFFWSFGGHVWDPPRGLRNSWQANVSSEDCFEELEGAIRISCSFHSIPSIPIWISILPWLQKRIFSLGEGIPPLIPCCWYLRQESGVKREGGGGAEGEEGRREEELWSAYRKRKLLWLSFSSWPEREERSCKMRTDRRLRVFVSLFLSLSLSLS